MLADSVGLALLVVLDTLEPAERLAFVLHDMFAVPFDEIATIIGCRPAAARQLASRARRRVQGAPRARPARQRRVVDVFLAASRRGQFDTLPACSTPTSRSARPRRRSWAAPARHAAPKRSRASSRVVRKAPNSRCSTAASASSSARPPTGSVRIALRFTVQDDRIIAVDVTADPEHLFNVDYTVL
ncbi:sigma factor-like helix-turn-helix DNA-binding protein [Allorhizocola rhizosphaerae]|uniref:sigma factor-like helix-turn-helix DNA-binding protein n=1 Tax=Allorhizocola rhizosphaerae TaxID=1872709 RepID=UPI00248250E9|nr:sigma factor-like helix-turn-helix DNA-binding protein [Allorhizocola rhizosphaerae]